MTAREMTALVIREAADHSGLSNMEIARIACISKSTITEAIRGRYSMRIETLARVVEACGMKLEITLRLEFPPTSRATQQIKPKL